MKLQPTTLHPLRCAVAMASLAFVAQCTSAEPTSSKNRGICEHRRVLRIERSQRAAIDDRYLTVREGALPIIITAPHGGTLSIPGVLERTGKGARKFTSVRDANTDLLAERLASEIEKRLGARPYLIIARFARKDLDVNRPPADAFESELARPYFDAYHRAVRSACEQIQSRWQSALLLDIHGQGVESETIFRGTNDGKTVEASVAKFGSEALTGRDSILWQLESKGYRVFPATSSMEKEDSHFNGGYTVHTYGGRERPFPGISALQLEFGSKFRAKRQVDTMAANVAAAVVSYDKAYLRPAADLQKQPQPPSKSTSGDKSSYHCVRTPTAFRASASAARVSRPATPCSRSLTLFWKARSADH